MAVEHHKSVPDHMCQKEEIIDAIHEQLTTGTIRFNDLNNQLGNMTVLLNDIKAQTTKTNGRVTKMETFALIAKVALVTFVVILLVDRFGIWDILKNIL